MIASFTLQVQLALGDLEAEVSLGTFEPALEVITTLSQHPARVLSLGNDLNSLVPDIFILAYLLPECYPSSSDHATVGKARDIWGEWVRTTKTDEQMNGVLASIKTKLQVLLCDTQVRPLCVLLVRNSSSADDLMQTPGYPPDAVTRSTRAKRPTTGRCLPSPKGNRRDVKSAFP